MTKKHKIQKTDTHLRDDAAVWRRVFKQQEADQISAAKYGRECDVGPSEREWERRTKREWGEL